MPKKPNSKVQKSTICIIGPGVVGQATGKVFAKLGFKTSFLGGSSQKRKKLQEEGYVSYDKSELFDGSYLFDVSFLTVPTPTIDGKISLDAIISASIDLGKRLSSAPKKYHVVVVKSTVPPGTTENIVIPLVEKYSGWVSGKEFGACMNPEYLREKTAYEDTLKPWFILIGEHDKKSGSVLAYLYKSFSCPIYRCSLKEAEVQKYIHNLYNATKITFFNEMRSIGKKIGIDTESIFQYTALSCEGMWNPKYGIKDLGPFSGSCLPKDTQAFLEWALKNKFNPHLLKMVIDVNKIFLEERHRHLQKQIGLQI